jgi:hypothetical protein
MWTAAKGIGCCLIVVVYASSVGCKHHTPGIYASDQVVTSPGKLRVDAVVVPHEDDPSYDHPPVHKVGFFAGQAQIGEGTLDIHCRVGAEINLPPGPSPQVVEMKTDEGRYTGRLHVWVLDPVRPVAVISHPALAYAPGGFFSSRKERMVRGDAVKVIGEFSNQYQPIYYMGGVVEDIEEARKWLEKSKFPLGPVLAGAGGGGFFAADVGLKIRLESIRNTIKADIIGIGAGYEEGNVMMTIGMTKVFLLPAEDDETEDYIKNRYPRSAVTKRTWVQLLPEITGQPMQPAPGAALRP